MNKEKQKLWNKIRSSRGLKGEESQLAQDVFSECYDTLTAKEAVEVDDKNLNEHVIRLNRENNRLRASMDKYREFGLFGCLQMREIENKKLKEALKFYAVIACPLPRQLKDNEACNLDLDNFYERGGKRARAVLKELDND